MCQVIGREPFLAVMPKTHRFYKKKTLTLADVLNETFLETEHATEALAAEVAYLHENTEEDERREVSNKLLRFETHFHCSKSKAICCLKDCLDPYTFATVMNDRNPPSKVALLSQKLKSRFKKGDTSGEKKENDIRSVFSNECFVINE